MPRAAATPDPRPSPQVAYAQWMDACAAAGWPGTPAAEQVPLRDGLARVTAVPVHARWPAPRSARAAMDGIAVKAGPLAAGVWQLAATSFTWVDTGDLMPEGTDTVVQHERVKFADDGSAQITSPAPPGMNVRTSGEDFAAGELLIPAGHRLRPADLAAAATGGHATLQVARRPVVAIIPTGDEIRPVGSALGPGDVTDSNSLLLGSRATEAGAWPAVSDVQPDDQDAIAAEVRRAALAADIVLVIAGSSAGRSDHTAAVVAGTGGLAVRGVAIRPGHPVLLGYVRPDRARAGESMMAVPVIGIPGYPLAAAVIFEVFAVPLLGVLLGKPAAGRAWQHAQLACDWTSSPDVEDWVPVSLAPAPGQPSGCPVVATPGRSGAGSISRLLRAHAWWPIPIGQGTFARGDRIDVQPVAGLPQ